MNFETDKNGIPHLGKKVEIGFTPNEVKAINLTIELANTLQQIMGNGSMAHNDMSELVMHIHAIQHAVMSQLAARVYPGQFRQLGGMLGGQ